MMYWNNHMTSGGWIFATLILVAVLVAAGIWTNRLMRKRQAPGPTGAASALEILDRRLANGEIKVDQYEQLRRTLAEHPATIGSARSDVAADAASGFAGTRKRKSQQLAPAKRGAARACCQRSAHRIGEPNAAV